MHKLKVHILKTHNGEKSLRHNSKELRGQAKEIKFCDFMRIQNNKFQYTFIVTRLILIVYNIFICPITIP